MQLTFLGTSSGTPTQERNVTALAVQRDGAWDLFDCGEGTQHQLLTTSLSLPKLQRIFISHVHGDHCFGLFGLLASRSMSRSTDELNIYGPAGLENMVGVVLNTSDTHLSFPITFHVVPEEGMRVVDNDVETIDAIALDHRVVSFAWHIQEAERPGTFDAARAAELGIQPGPDFGRLQRGESVATTEGTIVQPASVLGPVRAGRSLIVSGDNRDPDRLLARSGPVQTLVHEATFTEDVVAHMGSDQGHSTAARVSSAAELHGIDNLVLTHFSPRYGRASNNGHSISDIEAEARARYSRNLYLADDYATYDISIGGTLTQRC